MTLQSSVALAMGFGVPGDDFLAGPKRAQPGIIDSTGVTNPNRIGRAFTQVSAADGHCTVGGTPAEGTPFYGILANPKVYPERGTTAGTLAPSLDLPQYQVAEFVTMHTGLLVLLDVAANQGDLIDFDTTTGVLTARAPFINMTGSVTTNVLTITVVGTGSAPLQVGSVVNTTSGQSVVVSLGSGTGGTGTYNLETIPNSTSGPVTGNSAPASGKASVPRSRVVRYSISAPGLAVIEMTG